MGWSKEKIAECGDAALAKGRIVPAISCFNRINAKDKLALCGDAALAKKDFATAELAYQSANNNEMLMRLGDALVSAGKIDDAEFLFQQLASYQVGAAREKLTALLAGKKIHGH